METKAAVRALAALAQGTRLEVFRLLVEAGHGGRAAGEIAEAVGVAPATLSFHLKELANAGLADSRQDGRHVIYGANFQTMSALLSYLTENCCARDASRCAAEPCTTPDAAPRRARRPTAR